MRQGLHYIPFVYVQSSTYSGTCSIESCSAIMLDRFRVLFCAIGYTCCGDDMAPYWQQVVRNSVKSRTRISHESVPRLRKCWVTEASSHRNNLDMCHRGVASTLKSRKLWSFQFIFLFRMGLTLGSMLLAWVLIQQFCRKQLGLTPE